METNKQPRITTAEQLTNIEYMQRAVISDDTRAVLVAIGKIQDAENDITDLLERIFGAAAGNSAIAQFQECTGGAIKIALNEFLPDLIVEKWMGDRIAKPAQI